MTTESSLAGWLREEMPRKGYPVGGPRSGGITRLAQDAGISQATMSRLVNGQGEPSIDSLRKLGAIFGRTLNEMLSIAGLVDSAEVEPAARSDRPRLTVHDGGGNGYQSQPSALTEQEFERMLERGAEPPTPPGGFHTNDERVIWTLGQPARWRWDAIRTLRELQRQYRPHEKDPGRHA